MLYHKLLKVLGLQSNVWTYDIVLTWTSNSIFPQLFLRDSEQIEAATGAEEAFLSNDDLGVSPAEEYFTVDIHHTSVCEL